MEETDKYAIFKELKLNQDFIKNIKLFYIFRHNDNEINAIIVASDDYAYVFGRNNDGLLGFGHQNEVKELTLNEDLSNKQIIGFKNSFYHSIASSIDGKVYCWGRNGYGFLGNGRDDDEMNLYKPELNQYLSGKNIIDICCGCEHSLVLTNDGQVYAWGRNSYGQIGNGKNFYVTIPYHVNGFNGEKIKAIACGLWHSLALTEKRHVFSWGNNYCGQLGFKKLKENNSINVPKLIQINESFEKISCGYSHSLLLSDSGNIYLFGSNESGQLGDEKVIRFRQTPLKLKNQNKFIDIASHYRYDNSMALSKERVIFIWGKYEGEVIKTPIKTQIKSFGEVFAHYYQITYKTVIIGNKSNNKKYINKRASSSITVQPNRQKTPAKISKSDVTDGTKLVVNDKTLYAREFKELQMIGSGGFGIVYKSFKLFDEQNYAVKKIILSGRSDENKKKSLEELKLMAKLQSDHVVQYKNSWIENNQILYIQMELCFSNLHKILLKKRNEFQRKELQPMSRLEYYISSELFQEILESLNYLHKQIPSIIHRDLKPANILVTYGHNGRFVKLADFGLAVIHKSDDQTHTQGLGTHKYTAPEVSSGRSYDMKADVYSLGIVAQEIFDFDINPSSNNSISDQLLKGKYLKIDELVIEMTHRRKMERPYCDQILREKSLWTLDMNESEIDFSQLSVNEQSIEENFHEYFIRTKLRFS